MRCQMYVPYSSPAALASLLTMLLNTERQSFRTTTQHSPVQSRLVRGFRFETCKAFGQETEQAGVRRRGDQVLGTRGRGTGYARLRRCCDVCIGLRYEMFAKLEPDLFSGPGTWPFLSHPPRKCQTRRDNPRRCKQLCQGHGLAKPRPLPRPNRTLGGTNLSDDIDFVIVSIS